MTFCIICSCVDSLHCTMCCLDSHVPHFLIYPCSILVDRPTQLICVSDIYLLAVATPCGVADSCISGSCRSKKHTVFFFLLQNILSMYILFMKQQKTDKILKKKLFFSVLLDSVPDPIQFYQIGSRSGKFFTHVSTFLYQNEMN